MSDEQILEYSTSKQVELYNDGATLVGYASVFYQEGDEATQYEPFDGFVERVSPGAFREVIKRGDEVFAAVNHNMERILGRRGAQTLRIEEDDVGLRYKVDLPDTTLGRDIRAEVKRGDFMGSSIGFVPSKVETEDRGGVTIRTIVEVGRLRDVGPVHVPAFAGTSVSARSKAMLLAEYKALKRQFYMDKLAELV